MLAPRAEAAAAMEAEGFEFIAVKQEPFEGTEADGLGAVQEPECIIVQKSEPFEPCEDDTQQGGLNITQVGPCLPASGGASGDPLASGGHLEPEAAETYFDRTQFGDSSTASTETALSAQVEQDGTNREFAEYQLCKSSPAGNCNAATRRFQQRFKCSSCFSPFVSKYRLVHHVFTHIPGVAPPDHICKLCGEVSDDAESSLEHTTLHQKGQRGSSQTSERDRQNRVKNRAHGCTVCGKGFPTPQSLSIHTRTHSGERPYTCEICGKAFVQWVHLLNHKVTHSGEKPHRCGICGRPFGHVTSLKRHVRLHTGETPYRCDVCGMSFSLLDKLKKHGQVHTGKKTYSCEICGSSFAAPNSLKAHTRRHTDERPYCCNVCGESFMWSATFKRHKLTHTGEKPYGCNLCDRQFTELASLKRHMGSHSDDRPYSCDLCGATFRYLSSLATHGRLHTGEKPYGCNICGKRFTVSSHAKRHLQVHNKVREAQIS